MWNEKNDPHYYWTEEHVPSSSSYHTESHSSGTRIESWYCTSTAHTYCTWSVMSSKCLVSDATKYWILPATDNLGIRRAFFHRPRIRINQQQY
jgi:hypothetical protein